MARVAPGSDAVVKAAGGVVWRFRGGRPEVLLVHRPRYDDWTFPKGKLHPGEDELDAAVREVAEETGLRCTPRFRLTSTRYVDRRGRDKVVVYWAMTPGAGEFVPSEEVDEVCWATVASAAGMLSYERDQEVLRSFLEGAGDPATVSGDGDPDAVKPAEEEQG